jgi:hypothetical protein
VRLCLACLQPSAVCSYAGSPVYKPALADTRVLSDEASSGSLAASLAWQEGCVTQFGLSALSWLLVACRHM